MNGPEQTLSPSDIVAASGHVGYSWDLIEDRIVWLGAWRDVLGCGSETPPSNAAELATIILPNDHHLVFGDTPPSYDREYHIKTPDGTLVTIHEHGTTAFEKGRAVRQQGMLRRIEAPSFIASAAYSSPDRDPLTGRPNRSCMLALIEKIQKSPAEARNQSAYMVIGIDKLAFVNEAMGTKAGDLLICAVADRLNELSPARAIVGRVGGDAFGILLPGLARETDALANRILQSFHDQPILAGLSSLHLTVFVGSIAFAQEPNDPASLMIFGEQALAEARTTPAQHYVVYQKSEDRSEHNRAVLEIGERVKYALKNNTLRIAFQPVVDAKTGDIRFYEVLSRLFTEDGTAISPAEFIPIVEMLGLAPDFDRHVLEMAITELELSDTLRLAVNISGLTAALPDWPLYVQSKLSARPDIAQRLIIEITENAAVLDIAKIKCLVDSLRQMGSQVALDDFGAGSTSIRHLRDLSLAIMKIDRELLTNILTSPEQQHLVRMLTGMAHGLGLSAVAEGIETEEVAEWLRREGIDMLQGFHLGRPSLERPWLENTKTAASIG